MEFILEILILLIVARLFGLAAVWLGQPAMVGEMLAGIALAVAIVFLGPTLPFLARLPTSEVLVFAANAGIFFLVLFAGIEMTPKRMATYSAGAFAVALGGVVLPLVAGVALAWMFLPEGELKLVQAVLVGVVLSISAVPAMVKVLMDLGALETRFGQIVVTAAVFDDIVGLFLLAGLTSLLTSGGLPDLETLGWLSAKIATFFAVTMALGVHVYPRLSARISDMEAVALEFSVLIAVALAYGALAEVLGMHWVLGPFMAGLFFERERVGEPAYDDMHRMVGAVTGGVLGPLFIASIGLQVDFGAVTGLPVFLALLILVAMASKIIGAGLPARLIGLDTREATAVGIAMSARGGVDLVVIGIALERGFLGTGVEGEQLFSALVLVVVVTTLLAPILLRRVVRSPPRSRED